MHSAEGLGHGRTKGGDGEIQKVPNIGSAPKDRGRGPGHHLDALAVTLPFPDEEHRKARAQDGCRHSQAQHQQQVTCMRAQSAIFMVLPGLQVCLRVWMSLIWALPFSQGIT